MDNLYARMRQMESDLNYLRNDSPLPDDEKKERIAKIEKERDELISLVNFFSETNKKIDDLSKKDSLTREERKEISTLNKSLNTKRKEYNKKYQGKIRDLFSAYIGQVDKKIHNVVYKSNSFWRNKNRRVSERYQHTFKYFIKNAGISALMYFGSGLVLGPLAPAMFPVALGVSAAYLGQTVIKTVAAIYNKKKYGGPRLQRKYDISKSGYWKHVGDCWDEIVNSYTFSLSDVKRVNKAISISKDVPEGVKASAKDDSKDKSDSINTLVNSINKKLENIDVSSLSKEQMESIIKFISDNNLTDKLSDKAKEKYQQIVTRFGDIDKSLKVDDSLKTLVNSINKKLENIINVSSLSKEQMDDIVKIVNDNGLVDKLSDKAKEKYQQILERLNKINDVDDRKRKINLANDYLGKFSFKGYTLVDLYDIIKFINDNKLYNDLTDENKEILKRIKLLRDVMVEIDGFDMDKFNETKANEIINSINNNKLASQMLTKYIDKCKEIQTRLDALKSSTKKDDTDNKRKKTNPRENQKYKEKLKLLSDLLKKVDLSKFTLTEISTYINFIESNGLEKEFSDLLKQFKMIYDVKLKNEPKMSDYGNKRIGITGENQEFLARLFINHPTIIKKGESKDADEIRILAKKIKDGVATTADINRYAVLIYQITGDEWVQDLMEEYLDSEYDKYLGDKEEYEGKRAK